MAGNTLGSKNKKYATPTKEEILTFTDKGKGKSHIAEHYNVSIPVVDRWLKEHDIQIEKYHGRKYFTDEQKSRALKT
jgi:transposase